MSDSISFNNSESKFSGIDQKAWDDWGTPSEFFKDNMKSFKLGDDGVDGAESKDVIKLGDYRDNVEHPYHYTQGTQEAIDIIEEAIAFAPGPKTGFLQAQVLKYMLRLWHKIDAKEDAEKARWYLSRLIDSL